MQDQSQQSAQVDSSLLWRKTYTKVLDLVENLIVESEVIAGNDIDASILLDVPVGKTKSFGLSEEISLRELATPVCLSCLLQVTENAHAGETEDRSIVGRMISMLQIYVRSARIITHD